MHRFLFTIGFTGKSAEEFFALLQHAGVQTVIDVRQNRGGQLSAFAKHPDLEFFLAETAGISYRHEALLAPSPELRKKYQSDNDWAAYESGISCADEGARCSASGGHQHMAGESCFAVYGSGAGEVSSPAGGRFIGRALAGRRR